MMKLKKDKSAGFSIYSEQNQESSKLKATINPEGKMGIDDKNRVKLETSSPGKHMVFPEKHEQRRRKKKNKVVMMIFDPGSEASLLWDRVFLGSCILALFIDPLFLYVPKSENDGVSSCITTDSSLAIVLTCFRTLADILYLMNILIKFRTAYVDPNSRVFGRGELVMDPWLIAKRYLRSEFIIDLVATPPLPQILIWLIGSSHADHTNNALILIILLQYFPRLYLIFPLRSQIIKAVGVVTKTAWAGAAYNLLLYMLASHVLGASWYLFSFERNITCWQSECKRESQCAIKYLNCGTSNNDDRLKWVNATSVFSNCNPSNSQSFEYGIFQPAVSYNVSSIQFVHKYVYCLWWGLQNLSCYGQGLIASKFIGETTFSIFVCIIGLVLFAHLIGNMQKYLQSINVRVEQWRLKRRDMEGWMEHRQLPRHLRELVRRFIQYKWLATQGTDEDSILQGLPKDLRRDIQRYLCLDLIRRVPFFSQMDDLLLDAICERLISSLSTKGTYIVREGDPVTEMLFIIRGRLESSTTNGGRTGFFNSNILKAGDFCGGELLSWALLPTSTLNLPSSTRTVKALVQVEAFALKAQDLKFVANQFCRFHSKKLQHTFRFYSHQWRTWAACFIQASWRRYKNNKMLLGGHSQQVLNTVTSRISSVSEPIAISGLKTKSKRGAMMSGAVSRTYALFQSSSQTSLIKLDRGNYLVWESVVLPLIERNSLESHIDGLTVAPVRRLPGSSEINPLFKEWYAVDRMLVGWLRNTMTQEVGSQLLHCQTAYELWLGARNLTSASTRGRIMAFKSQLHSTRKDNLKMDEYLNRMKTIADQLALAGAPISTEDLIIHTLTGLDREYNTIVVKLMDQHNLTWIEAQSSLIAFESRLEQLTQFSALTIQPSINLAQKEASHENRGSDSRRSFDGERGGSGRGARGRRGGGRGRRGQYHGNYNGGTRRPYCTYCDRYGHVFETCYSRTDRSPRPQPPSDFGRSSYYSPQAYYASPQTVTLPST